MFSVQELARCWRVTPDVVRKMFRARHGVVLVGGAGRPTWRIPASLALAVLVERGYDQARASEMMRQLEGA